MLDVLSYHLSGRVKKAKLRVKTAFKQQFHDWLAFKIFWKSHDSVRVSKRVNWTFYRDISISCNLFQNFLKLQNLIPLRGQKRIHWLVMSALIQPSQTYTFLWMKSTVKLYNNGRPGLLSSYFWKFFSLSPIRKDWGG